MNAIDDSLALPIWTQSAGEEVANGISHGIGLVGAIIGTPILVVAALHHSSLPFLIGTMIFAATMLLVYLASTLYHVDLRSNTTEWRFRHANMTTAPLAVGSSIFVGTSTGRLLAVDASTGDLAWSGDAGSPISAPDESGTSMLAGLAAAGSTVIVPATNVLATFGD